MIGQKGGVILRSIQNVERTFTPGPLGFGKVGQDFIEIAVSRTNIETFVQVGLVRKLFQLCPGDIGFLARIVWGKNLFALLDFGSVNHVMVLVPNVLVIKQLVVLNV